jgi:hypothetical protein
VPKIPDPWLLKLLVVLPAPVKIPFTVSNFVVPVAEAALVPAPEPSPPAEPNKLIAIPVPPPKFVASPPLDPVPIVVSSPNSVPVVPLSMSRAPLPVPKPPVGPVENGVTMVVKVEGAKPVELPPFLLLFLMAKAAPGTSVITELNPTGLKPAPKPPVPEEVVVPPKLRIPVPPNMMPTVPACEPVPPPAELPVAAPDGVLMKPELPLVLVKFPAPVESASAAKPASSVSMDPVPVALPPPVDVPEMIPPVKGGLLTGNNPNCNFLDPLRLLLVVVLLLEA